MYNPIMKIMISIARLKNSCEFIVVCIEHSGPWVHVDSTICLREKLKIPIIIRNTIPIPIISHPTFLFSILIEDKISFY